MTAPLPDAFDMVLRNDLSELERLASTVDGWIEAQGFDPAIAFYFNVVLDELLTNTISYGYPADASREINVRVQLIDTSIIVTLVDDAAAFDPFTDAPAPDLDSDLEERPIGGLGVYFTQTFMDAVSYHRVDDKNIVALTKEAAPPPP